MSDSTTKNTAIINGPIGGPPAAQLNEQLRPRSLDEIANEHTRQIEAAVKNFGGQNFNGGK